MTFQPPPPPPGGTPPAPPPPGQWGPGAGGGSQPFDPKNVSPLDWALIGIGFLVFIFSFISFYSGASYDCSNGPSGSFPGGYSASAWHDVFGGGFFGWFAMLFALAAAVLVALDLFAPQVKLPMANRLAALGLFALAALFEIIAIFVTPGESVGGFGAGSCDISADHGAGFWISLILILAGTVIALMRAQQTGTQLPGPLGNMPNIGSRGPQGGSMGGGGMGGGSMGGGMGTGTGGQNPPAPPPPPPPAP